jgi:hypothetical protein
MKRLIVLLAALVLLALGLATPATAAHPKDQGTMQNGGDGDHGSSWDFDFGGPSHYVYASWDRGNQETTASGNAVWSTITLRIDTNNLPDTPLGNRTCVQVAIDWRVPQNANHYDSRVLYNCDPNSSVTWTFSEKTTQNNPPDCRIGSGGTIRTVPCSSPMGRVQFARYVPDNSAVVGPMDCRAMAGISFSDCTSWDPWCPYNACRYKLRSLDGTTRMGGSLDATDPNN